jgi:hypothetical protein
MAGLAVEVDWKKAVKFGAAVAALLTLPNLVQAQQSSRMSGEWLQVTPANPRTALRSTSEDSDGSIWAPTERRSSFRTRRDSIAGMKAYEASKKDKSLHLVVSLEEKRLWVVVGRDTVLDAPVAIGSGTTLVFGEKVWSFETPRGIRTVRGKDSDPDWIPPEWHYAETAREHGLSLKKLTLGSPTKISGKRKIMFQDGEAGVMHPDSGFFLLPLDEEIVFDNTLFIPPVGSKNRKVQGELGKYKLDTGAGVLLHGTPHQTTIGKAATHGCMRLRDEDIEWLFDYVPVGTKVYIY